MGEAGGTTPTRSDTKSFAERAKATVTRRDFLIGAGAGAATAGVVLGGTAVATKAFQPTTTTASTTGTANLSTLPATMRRVELNIDGAKHTVVVDTRESLWETMNFQLGLSNANLGCDRAQCGACAVLVDGRSMNSCTILSARLGRGQQIKTVASLATGPGVAGLHPIQRAYWLEGGFQCGICTRGFIMSTFALLTANPKPDTAQISEALSGNICRCGEYAKIFKAVNTAAAEMRGEKVTYRATPVVVEVQKVATTSPTAAAASKDFEFATPLDTIEQLEPFATAVKKTDGIIDVSGSERQITVKWDPAKLDEAKVRALLAAAGHGVK
ncbi:MAG: (2Fe-2S)-binding protein [Chloroflexi bacterium]|nr:MAG: (2Fe-2S)-binding protein [Chloroflexota bacterium]TMG71022.1 MAG: (2Fe-2S)-binding protein [Chloroflexota bacterium]